MSFVGVDHFAKTMGMTDRAARKVYANAAQGKPWRGEVLPVVSLPGNRGGNAGTVWGLALDRCSPTLRDRLDALLPVVQSPIQRLVKRHVEDWQYEEQKARLRIIQPILETAKSTPDLMHPAPKVRMVPMTHEDISRYTDALAEVSKRMSEAENVFALLARIQQSGDFDGDFGIADMAAMAAGALPPLAPRNLKTSPHFTPA